MKNGKKKIKEKKRKKAWKDSKKQFDRTDKKRKREKKKKKNEHPLNSKLHFSIDKEKKKVNYIKGWFGLVLGDV